MSKWTPNVNPDETEAEALAAPEPWKPEPWQMSERKREIALRALAVIRAEHFAGRRAT